MIIQNLKSDELPHAKTSLLKAFTFAGASRLGIVMLGLAAGELATLLIIFNPWQDVVKFKLPAATALS